MGLSFLADGRGEAEDLLSRLDLEEERLGVLDLRESFFFCEEMGKVEGCVGINSDQRIFSSIPTELNLLFCYGP